MKMIVGLILVSSIAVCESKPGWVHYQVQKNQKTEKSSASCNPQCKWTCQSESCEQDCNPVCNEALCTTRCKGFNMDTCKMKCEKPKCVVICPKKQCPGGECAKCTTRCGKPACKMECGSAQQPCQNICAEPTCKWHCKTPKKCPKPECKLECEGPSCKPTAGIGSTCPCAEAAAAPRMVKQLPPLAPGETEVISALAPPSKENKAAAFLMAHKMMPVTI